MNAPAYPAHSGHPDLLHRTAFNLCASLAGMKPAHLVAGIPFYAAELSYRSELSKIGKNERPSVLLWAGPRPEIWPEIADWLQRMPPGGLVLVLTTGWGGRRFIRNHLKGLGVGDRFLGPKTIARLLAQEGFRVTALYGVGGPAYQFWGGLARLAAWTRRDDRADRLHARARRVLLAEGDWVEMSLLVILVANR